MGIIFDLDGTLLDTIDDIAQVTNLALTKNGYPAHDKKKYSAMVGHGLKNLVSRVLPEKAGEREIEAVYTTLVSEYMKNPVQHSLPYPGIPELLDELAQRKIPVAILSNKLNEITQQIAQIIFDKWKFSAVFGSRENIPKKPDPYSALEICKIMNLEASDVFFVGDSETDMATAHACGMHPVGVSWGYRSIAQITKAGAEILLDTPMDMLKYL